MQAQPTSALDSVPSTVSFPDDPWPLLHRVRTSAVKVHAPGQGAPALRHEGRGTVAIETPDAPPDSSITWLESGRWVGGPLRGIAFRNATLWERPAGEVPIRLSHLRRGAGQPTLLVTLRPVSPRCWRSAAPHLCGPDRYAAQLTWDDRTLTLLWEVVSPTDPYLLEWTATFG